ncbi:ATP-dependent RNA helicase [Pseudoscourfieldia marina]
MAAAATARTTRMRAARAHARAPRTPLLNGAPKRQTNDALAERGGTNRRAGCFKTHVARPPMSERATAGGGASSSSSSSTSTLFSDAAFALDEDVVTRLREYGVTVPTPVQAETFQEAREGKDVLARALTGTGKTLAYILPVTCRLLDDKVSTMKGASGTRRRRAYYNPETGKAQGKRPAARPRAVAVLPTRELARQVSTEWRMAFGKATVGAPAVFGGAPLERHQAALRTNPLVVVGTPGRLLELMRAGNLEFSHCDAIILDEADRLMEEGFSAEVGEILDARLSTRLDEAGDPLPCQTLLFSATIPPWVRALSEKFMPDAVPFDLAKQEQRSVPSAIVHMASPVVKTARTRAVADILSTEDARRALVFCATKNEAETLAEELRALAPGWTFGALHGDLDQRTRNRELDRFKTLRAGFADRQCLLATDVASRGIDVADVDLVIQLGVPRIAGRKNTADSDLYIHRVGRCGRAGKSGKALLLYDPSAGEYASLEKLAKGAGVSIGRVVLPSPEDCAQAAAMQLLARGDCVCDDARATVRTAVEKLAEDGGVSALSRALEGVLAVAVGHGEGAPPSRSLLTAQEGVITLAAHGASGPSEVVRAAKVLMPRLRLGRVSMENKLALFDVDVEVASKLAGECVEGIQFEVAKPTNKVL